MIFKKWLKQIKLIWFAIFCWNFELIAVKIQAVLTELFRFVKSKEHVHSMRL